MNKIKKLYKDLINTQASPESLALGFATGTLIAILPTPGFGIFIGLFLALLFKKINKLSLIIAFSVWNPFLLIPVYGLCYLLGDLLFTPDPNIRFTYQLFNEIYHYSGKFIVGNLLIATSGALISYYLVYQLICLRQDRKGTETGKVFKMIWFTRFYKVK